MSFFLSNYLSVQKNEIRPLHSGFGFFADEIQKKLGFSQAQKKQNESTDSNQFNKLENNNEIIHANEIAQPLIEEELEKATIFQTNLKNKKNATTLKYGHQNTDSNKYYVNPFLAFLAWTIDALLGFCFLIISLCINFVFLPKGFFALSPNNAKLLSFMTSDLNLIYTFLFSLQVWVFMFFLVFIFQYAILGFEGSTLGRWIFSIAIKNHKDIDKKVNEKTKIYAALSEAFLLGGILSFLFIILFPSRVPIFFWLRYSSKK